MSKRHVLRYHTGALTSGEEGQLEKIRQYQARQPKQNYTPEEAVEAWREVRQGTRKQFPKGSLQNQENRQQIIRTFTEEFKVKNGRYPEKDEFYEAKLAGLMEYYNASPFAAFQDAGYATIGGPLFDVKLAHLPWTVLEKLPQNFWDGKWNRTRAIRWLTTITQRKEKRYPTQEDFENSGLCGLISGNYNGSPLEAFEEAGYTTESSKVYDKVLAETPWKVMQQLPKGFWDKETRARAVRLLVEETGKEVSELTQKDFIGDDLSRLLTRKNGSPHALLREAGYAVEKREMDFVPKGTWKDKRNTTEALRITSRVANKPIGEVTTRDMFAAGYSRVLKYHKMEELKQLAQKDLSRSE